MYTQAEKESAGTLEAYIDTGIATVPGDDSIGEALDVMIAHNTSVVMVVDGDEVIGLLTAGDMSSMVARGIDIETRRARDFASLCEMSGSRPCTRVNHDEDPMNVLKVMQHWGTDRVLVVKNERVVGTVSALGALKSWKEKV